MGNTGLTRFMASDGVEDVWDTIGLGICHCIFGQTLVSPV